MARPLLIAYPENAPIEELKQVSRSGALETAARCSAIQMLPAGTHRDLVCKAMVITNRALRKSLNRFHQGAVDGLIVTKRPGKTAITNSEWTMPLNSEFRPSCRRVFQR